MKKNNKPKNSVNHVYEALFGCNVYLLVCSHDEFYNNATKIFPKHLLGQLEIYVKENPFKGQKGRTFTFEDGTSLIWTDHNQPQGVLLHEITHSAFHLLRVVGIPLTYTTEEVYSYLIAFLFNNLTKK